MIEKSILSPGQAANAPAVDMAALFVPVRIAFKS
jgi:hypothetical protein